MKIPDKHTPAAPQSQIVKVVKDIVSALGLQSEPAGTVKGLNAGAVEQTQEV